MTLLIAQTGISYLALKSKKLRSIICGKPTIMVENGKINWENFRDNLYNLDDLQEQLRTKGFFDLQDVEFALLETNGSLSVLPKADRRPLTPADMKIDPGYEGLSLPLIMDGEIRRKTWKGPPSQGMAGRGIGEVRDYRSFPGHHCQPGQ